MKATKRSEPKDGDSKVWVLPTGEEIVFWWSTSLQCWITIPED